MFQEIECGNIRVGLMPVSLQWILLTDGQMTFYGLWVLHHFYSTPTLFKSCVIGRYLCITRMGRPESIEFYALCSFLMHGNPIRGEKGTTTKMF